MSEDLVRLGGKGYAQRTVGRFAPDSEKADVLKADRFHNRVRRHIQTLAQTGEPQIDRIRQLWYPPERGERPTAIFDYLGFHPDLRDAIATAADLDTSTEIFGRRLRFPFSFGDMSAGALHPNLNIALAFAAEEAGILCGTGEGGLLPELYGLQNIIVQWSSARWGVTEESIVQGCATVFKAGQGAKPIGGELPEEKLMFLQILQLLRKFFGADAISPAVHKDVYSIEDLGRRLNFLQMMRELLPLIRELRQKQGASPYVGVKFVPGSKAGAVACGVARMGGDVVQVDGKGAGTGATPKAVCDNMGFDIEYSVPMIDRMLGMEQDPATGQRLRSKTKIMAGGRISSMLDLAILLALGADAGFAGTAAMIAAGCKKADDCKSGRTCPAGQTNLLLPTAIDTHWAFDQLVRYARGSHKEFQAILRALREAGISSVADLVGRRDLLYAHAGLTDETVQRLGVQRWKQITTVSWATAPDIFWPWRTEDEKFWSVWRLENVEALAKTDLPHKRSMGTQGSPFTSLPHTATDHLTLDVAQITNPQGDGYRQHISVATFLGRTGQLRTVDGIHMGKPATEHARAFAEAAKRTGSLFITDPVILSTLPAGYRKNAMVELENPTENAGETAGVILPDLDYGHAGTLSGLVENHRSNGALGVAVRLRADDPALETKAVHYARAGVDALVVQGALGLDPRTALEVGIRRVQRKLLQNKKDKDTTLRQECSILAEAVNIRESGDILKLHVLGADGIFTLGAPERAMDSGPRGAQAVVNLKRALRREMQLMMGGDGAFHIESIIGNTDVIRSVNMPSGMLAALDVQPAGMKLVD